MSPIFLILQILALCGVSSSADTDNFPTEFDFDPYLEYRPPFARSLPVQILLTGVVLTLVAVLFIHLIFTAQYHWPLAPVNYVLQLSGVTTLLISLIATLHVVLSATQAESQKWPYMLSYIAVNVPPPDPPEDTADWTIAERATWLVMNASTSGLIQITHIQFLTLLYPSRLEGRLIFALLGPLAIVAAVMQLLQISGNPNVNYISSAVRNVCNATLSLLFTVALFIWGLLVNRKQAWRTDGGTAAFGCAALVLALVSSALNFLYVPREEEYVWLPGLMWAVVLWQSFLGWWWWVGAGSGLRGDDDDMEEKLLREAKRESRRREAREKRKVTKQRAKKVWKDVAGAFGPRESRTSSSDKSGSLRSRHHPDDPPTSDSPPGSPAASATPFTSPTLSVTSVGTFTTLPRILPGVIHQWYASLRRAHLVAARQQAVERVERIRELERSGSSDLVHSGWGLGSFWWRIGNETTTRRARPGPGRDFELYDRSEWRRRRGESTESEGNRRTVDRGSHVEHHDDGQSGSSTAEAPRHRGRGRERGGEVDDGDDHRPKGQDHPFPPALPAPTAARVENARSLWWWGPLSRWRLQDSTVY